MAANATGENGPPWSSPAVMLNSIVSPFSFLEIAVVGWVSYCASKEGECGILLWSACRHVSRDSSPNAFVQSSCSYARSPLASIRACIVSYEFDARSRTAPVRLFASGFVRGSDSVKPSPLRPRGSPQVPD